MTIDNIIDNLEYKEQVVDHIKYEAGMHNKTASAMLNEWLNDYAEPSETEWFAYAKEGYQVPTYVSDAVIDTLVEHSSPREVGEQYNIDWTGLAESFGLR